MASVAPISQLQTSISSAQLLNSGNPLPAEFRCRMKYSQTQVVSSTSSIDTFGTEFSLRLNSIFDPDFSIGGHQPYGYDQFAPFYGRYIVTAAHVEIVLTDPSNDGVVLGVQVKNQQSTKTVANSTIDEVAERQGCFVVWANNNGNQTFTRTFSVPMHTLLGYDNQQQLLAARSDVGALYGSDPAAAQQTYLSFALANARSLGTAPTAIVAVRVTYDVVLFARLQMNQS